MTYTAIDLSRLPAPGVVEALDPEAIIAAIKASVIAAVPELAAALDLESEPVVKLIEVMAYRETLIRARVNDAARAVMLATATGADLDNLGALLGVARLVLTPADPDAIPPVAAVMEGDSDLRRRIQLSLEGFSTAGPTGAYLFHALSADGDVLDVSVTSPSPGVVEIVVLARDGAPPPELLAKVAAAVNADRVRPLCDAVTVLAATVVDYDVTASLVMLDGPDSGAVRDAAEAAVQAYVVSAARLGRAVRISALLAALHQPGVERVILAAPLADIEPDADEAAWCGAVTVTVAP